MSKWASFATGMGEGYLSAKRFKDTKKERDEDRQMLKDVLMGRAEKAAEDKSAVLAASSFSTAADDSLGMRGRYEEDERGFANGGMIGEMPKHWDKMEWQRTSFKKGTR